MTKILFFVSFILVCTQCLAEKTDIMVVGAEFPPYATNKPPFYGITNEVIQRIFEDSGFSPQIKIKPFARALTEAKNGTADVVVALYKTKEREKYLDFSDSLIKSNVFLYTTINNPIKFDTLQSLSGNKVGLIRKTSTRLSLFKNPKIEINYVNHYLQGLEMVKLGRLDFMAGDELVIQYLLNKPEQKHLKESITFVRPALRTEHTYIAISKRSLYRKQLLNRLNQGIATLKETGQLKALIQKHLNTQ